MPEGPEIRRAADELAAVLERRKAQSVAFGLPRLARFADNLTGERIRSVYSRSKALLLEFGNGQTVFTHNQLYGKWFVRPRGRLPATNRQLRLRIDTREHSALLYSASNIAVLAADELDAHPYLAALGPEALDEAVDAGELAARLADKRFASRSLAALYLDQSFLAGIGNYLRSEILFAARVAPALRPRDLDAAARRRVARQSLAITRRSYATGGITNSPKYVKQQKARGAARGAYRFFVFGRSGAPCYVCGTRIARTALAGRRLYYCATCQDVA